MGRLIAWVCGGALALVVLASGAVAGVVGAITGAGVPGAACQPARHGPAGLDGGQTCNAAVIVHVGQSMRVPGRGLVIAIATALQESNLRNLAGGDRDSVGLFQQRPSQGWGTRVQLRDAAYAARQFYEKLLTVSGWRRMPVAQAAQAVQRSAFPDAYATHETRAKRIVAACRGGRCGVSAGRWVRPSTGRVVSGFRTAGRAGHDGIDLGAPRGAPVRAASAGVVTLVACDSSSGTCDRDGNPSVLGCGWHVEIRHAGGITTRYCHMLRRPHVRQGQAVAAGQPIGVVGSSGNSSGPHLHFEVHTGHPATHGNATDPVTFMKAHGVKL